MTQSAATSPRALLVGLTGGIASGKSAVAAMFQRLGAELIDTDQIAREVVAKGTPGLEAIRRAFGPHVVAAGGDLDRAALRKLVFADPAERERLERITHPLIRARTRERMARAATPYAIVAVPLLVETDFGELVDRIAVVDCPESVQLARLMRRDALPRAEAEAMLRAQADRAARLRVADDVIDNGGELEATRRQVAELDRRYRELARNVAHR